MTDNNPSVNQNNPQVKPGDPEYNPHGVSLTPRFSVGQKVRVKKGYQRENQDGRYKPGVYDGDTLTIKESGTWGTTVMLYAFDEIDFVIKERWLEAETGSDPHDDAPRGTTALAITYSQMDAWRKLSETELEQLKNETSDMDVYDILNQLVFIFRYEREIAKCNAKINAILAAQRIAPAQPSAPAVADELDDLTRADMQADVARPVVNSVLGMLSKIEQHMGPDAAQPEAARAKPAAVKLSKRQIEFLSLAVRNGGEVHHRNAIYIASGRGNAAVMKGLVSLGLMEDRWRGWTITDKGRDALEAVAK